NPLHPREQVRKLVNPPDIPLHHLALRTELQRGQRRPAKHHPVKNADRVPPPHQLRHERTPNIPRPAGHQYVHHALRKIRPPNRESISTTPHSRERPPLLPISTQDATNS